MKTGRALAVIFVVALSASFARAGQSQSEAELLKDGLRLLNAKQFSQAEQAFSLLVRKNPSPVNTGYLAVAESGAGQLGPAINDFTRAIRLGNDSLLTRYGLGTAYLRDHQPAAAVRELRLVIARDPSYIPARYAMGMALAGLGRPRQAIPFLDAARASAPGNAEFWLALVRAHFEAGDSKLAAKLAEQAIAAAPGDPHLALALARLCLHDGQPQSARELLENAVEAQPRDPGLKLLLARVCLQLADPSEALALLQAVPREAARPGEVALLSGEARALSGNLVMAQSDVGAAIEADPRNAGYLVVAAWLDQMQARYSEALSKLQQAQALGAAAPAVLYQKAVSYFYLRQYQQAEAACAAVIRSAPRDGRAYLLLGLCKLRSRDPREAEGALERAVALSPGDAMAHRELGVALLKMGILARSENEFDAALTLNPRDARSYFWRAQALARQGKRGKAIEDLESSVMLDPTFAEAYHQLARLYAASGQAGKAAAALKKQMKLQKIGETPAESDAASFKKLGVPPP